MRGKRIIWIIAAFSILAFASSGCMRMSRPDEVIPLPEKIELYYFHDTACGSCDGTEEFFTLFEAELQDAKDLYPYSIIPMNVFKQEEHQSMLQVLESYGHDANSLDYPVLMVHSKLFEGMESIRKNLREAYLTAGEDIFENRFVYNPARPQEAQLEDDTCRLDQNTVVYFYRITCDECSQVKPVIDELEQGQTAAGNSINVIRMNTRSGNNSEWIGRFFEAYSVPDEDQMVPIVFLADTYLAGYDAIAKGLPELLKNGGTHG